MTAAKPKLTQQVSSLCGAALVVSLLMYWRYFVISAAVCMFTIYQVFFAEEDEGEANETTDEISSETEGINLTGIRTAQSHHPIRGDESDFALFMSDEPDSPVDYEKKIMESLRRSSRERTDKVNNMMVNEWGQKNESMKDKGIKSPQPGSIPQSPKQQSSLENNQNVNGMYGVNEMMTTNGNGDLPSQNYTEKPQKGRSQQHQPHQHNQSHFQSHQAHLQQQSQQYQGLMDKPYQQQNNQGLMEKPYLQNQQYQPGQMDRPYQQNQQYQPGQMDRSYQHQSQNGSMDNRNYENGNKSMPRGSNPRQVYVGGLPFRTLESDLKDYFSHRCGRIDQVKLLRQQDGKSKGVAFITFNNAEDAEGALQFHDTEFEGRLLTVRIANPASNKNQNDKPQNNNAFAPRSQGEHIDIRQLPPATLNFINNRVVNELNSNDPNKRHSNISNPMRQDSFDNNRNLQNSHHPRNQALRYSREELDVVIRPFVEVDDIPLETTDFDFHARRLLSELKYRDKQQDTNLCEEALQMVRKCCATKDREGVRNWKAYVYTLLAKFAPELSTEFKERDQIEREKRKDSFN